MQALGRERYSTFCWGCSTMGSLTSTMLTEYYETTSKQTSKPCKKTSTRESRSAGSLSDWMINRRPYEDNNETKES
jgi:hypothetical protein